MPIPTRRAGRAERFANLGAARRLVLVALFVTGLQGPFVVARPAAPAQEKPAGDGQKTGDEKAGHKKAGGEADDLPTELEVERVERSEVKVDPATGPAPLARDLLPERTRKPPDPAHDQFVRDPVYVRVAEVITDSRGETSVPDVQLADRYLREYLRRAGFRIAAHPGEARFRLEGDLEARFVKEFRLQGKPIGFVVDASCTLFVLRADGSELERLEIPNVRQENVKSERSAFVQLRRRAAKVLWERLQRDGKTFANDGAWALVDRLAQRPAPGAVGSTAEEITDRLADLGLAVVPVLLEALADTRPVLVASEYPGLTEANRAQLKVYHIADKALEELFQKVSRMDLDTPARWRFVIIKGWEGEWSRFCPPWRDSPVRQARAARAKAKAEARAAGG